MRHYIYNTSARMFAFAMDKSNTFSWYSSIIYNTFVHIVRGLYVMTQYQCLNTLLTYSIIYDPALPSSGSHMNYSIIIRTDFLGHKFLLVSQISFKFILWYQLTSIFNTSKSIILIILLPVKPQYFRKLLRLVRRLQHHLVALQLILV